MQRQQNQQAAKQLQLHQQTEAVQRQQNQQAAKELQSQEKTEALQRQQEQQAAKELQLQEKTEKNQSGYQLKTFEFETAEISLKSQLLGLVRKPEIKYISKSGKYFTEDLENGIFLEMVHIPGGTFIMGSPKNEEGYDLKIAVPLFVFMEMLVSSVVICLIFVLYGVNNENIFTNTQKF